MKQGVRCSYWGKDAKTHVTYFIDKVSRLGFDVLELEAGMVMERTDEQLRMLRQYAADRGIVLTVGGGSLRSRSLCDPDAAVRNAGLTWRTKLIEKMEILGAEIVCGPMHSYWPYDFQETIDIEAERTRSVESLRELAKVAGNHGVCLCVEVVNRFENPVLNTAADGVSFCRDIGSKHVKLLLDTFHMNIEEDSIPMAIRQAGLYLGHLHTGEGNRKVPGKGHLPWREICEALQDIGYEGSGVMEPVVRNDVPGAQAFRLWRMQADCSEEALDRDAAEAARFLRTLWRSVQETRCASK